MGRPHNPIPIEEIRYLYVEQNWHIKRIADHFAVTRQNISGRLKHSGIKKVSEVRGPKALRFTKEQLVDIYVGKRLSVKETAKELNCGIVPVKRELARHGIKVRPIHMDGARYLHFDKLDIGDELIVRTKRGTPPSFAFGEAKRLGIRIVARRVGPDSFRVIRTPLLNQETVNEFKNQGKSVLAMSKIFLAARKTIKRYLNKAPV